MNARRRAPRRPRGLDARSRRVGAHSAGVRPLVAVERALEVLRRREGDRVVAVAQREQRDLRRLRAAPPRAQLPPKRARAARSAASTLLLRPADEDALPGGEAVGLHDAGRPRDRQARRAVGTPAAAMHLLRERLRALDSRGGCARPEDRDAEPAQRVREAERRAAPRGRPRRGRPRASRESPSRPSASSARIGWHCAEPRDAGVPGRRVQLLEARRLRELPGERMLTAARADDEDLAPRESTSRPARIRGQLKREHALAGGTRAH